LSIPARRADAEQTSFWSDDEQFSAAGQLIEANYLDSLVTPLPATLPPFAAGLGALGSAWLAEQAKERRRYRSRLTDPNNNKQIKEKAINQITNKNKLTTNK
jgi:hypothetical protein